MKALLILLISMSFGFQAQAASKKNTKTAKPKKQLLASTSKSKLGTNFDFEDLVVRGKYQYADEALATVENEKGLDDLLQVRKHFKDRLKQSASRR